MTRGASKSSSSPLSSRGAAALVGWNAGVTGDGVIAYSRRGGRGGAVGGRTVHGSPLNRLAVNASRSMRVEK